MSADRPFDGDEPSELWSGVPVGALAARWEVPALHAYRRVGSTSDVARRLALEGAPAGTTVVADEQVAGRGRGGRAWSSPPGLGLWLSLLARPAPLDATGALPLLVGLAVARALDAFLAPGAVRVKWPNDLFAEGRKLGGILCEGSWMGGTPGFVVVGVGINVRHEPHDFPPELRGAAISLRIASGGDAPLLDVAGRVVPALRACLLGPLAITPAILSALAERDLLRGRAIAVSDPATATERGRGTAAGIAEDGALLLREPSGAVRPIHAGTVRLINDLTADP